MSQQLKSKVYTGKFYECEKCGAIVKRTWRTSPNGDYTYAKCSCGNAGRSNWYYDIPNFKRVKSN